MSAIFLVILSGPAADARGGALPMAIDLIRKPGAESCPDRDALAARLVPRLSETEASRGPSGDRVLITVERIPAGYVATVSVPGIGGGIRNLVDDGDDCAGLAEALVLTLSMISDGQVVPSVHVPELPPTILASSHAPRPWQLGARALVSTGMLAATTAGTTLDVVWHPWPRIATGLSGLWMPARSIDQGGGTVRFTIVAAMARACAAILPFGRRFLPALCAEAAAGGLRGSSEGYDGARSVWAPWLTTGGSVDLGVRVHSRFSVAAQTGYLFSLRDARFTVGGLGRVYDSGHPGWFAGLGALVQIP